VVTAAAVASAVVTAVLLVVFWPGEAPEVVDYQPFATELYDARVEESQEGACPGASEEDLSNVEVRCLDLQLRLEEGPNEGDTAFLNYVVAPGAPEIGEGDAIVVGYSPEAEEGFQYYFADFQRETPLLLLTLLFVVAVLLLGRFGGLRALLGAGASLVVLVVFLLPTLLDGTTPVLAALVAAAAIALLALYLTHGFSHQTSVAYLGTVASLGLTGLLAAVFIAATNLTGLADETVTYLQLSVGDIDVRGLLLAGVVIGALGVIDDVTVTQVSAVWQLHGADPELSATQLYRSALTIGRDHIASTVNTLVLVYAGASLPLLLLFTQARQPLDRILTGEVVATEVVRTLVGSIGLVASVPITTALAVAVVGARREPREDTDDEEIDAEPTADPVPEPPSATWSDFRPEERDF
jgi:uncharacterized membrane protein